MKRRVAVYGGTFDPFHAGHEWFIDYVLNELEYDEVILLVEPRPRRKQGASDVEHRNRMAGIVLKNRKGVSLNVVSVEGRFSLRETMARIDEYTGRGAEVALMMGGDVFEHLAKWGDLEEYKNRLQFIVALRTEDDGEIAVRLMQGELSGYDVKLVQSQMPLVSSTKVRKELDKSSTANHVNQEVADYARDNELYS